jgi:hypothetical protein
MGHKRYWMHLYCCNYMPIHGPTEQRGPRSATEEADLRCNIRKELTFNSCVLNTVPELRATSSHLQPSRSISDRPEGLHSLHFESPSRQHKPYPVSIPSQRLHARGVWKSTAGA